MQFLRAFSSSSWWLSWRPATRRLLQRVSRARRAYPRKEARSVHRDRPAPPDLQLRLSVRRLTCVYDPSQLRCRLLRRRVQRGLGPANRLLRGRQDGSHLSDGAVRNLSMMLSIA
jgi:hypothetical protein